MRLNDQHLHKGGKWIGARVRIGQNDPCIETPKQHHCLEDLSPGELELFISQSRIICFDEEDRYHFLEFLENAGVSTEGLCVVSIKAEALDIAVQEEGTFFSVGYYGPARSDLPAEPVVEHNRSLEALAFCWMCSIANVGHAYAYECQRYEIGDGSNIEPGWDKDLLIQT